MTVTLSDIANLATAAGVLIAVWQLWVAHQQSVTAFEDSFAREYRELAARLPTKALLGEGLTEPEYRRHLDEFYHYFDLCNEQTFLFKLERISPETWKQWHDGMASNIRRPAFERAWSDICARSSDFAELREFFPPKVQQKAAGNEKPSQQLQVYRNSHQIAAQAFSGSTPSPDHSSMQAGGVFPCKCCAAWHGRIIPPCRAAAGS